MSGVRDVLIDALVGPTHNFGGLSPGNLASAASSKKTSHPKKAAMEGLEKMKRVMELGIPQLVLPPHPRPYMPFLREMGFLGSDKEVLDAVFKKSPELLLIANSASSMWTANMATITPSSDAHDKKVHITPANLSAMLHRSIECHFSTELLQRIFPEGEFFSHHTPAPPVFGDEGAANHMRFGRPGKPGVNVFVHGCSALDSSTKGDSRFPLRQTHESQVIISRNHQLHLDAVEFFQQNHAAINAGVFHNDVIAMNHRLLLLCHKQAYEDQKGTLESLKKMCELICEEQLTVAEVPSALLSLDEAVASYVFNSQWVTTSRGETIVFLPEQSQHVFAVRECLEDWKAQKFYDKAVFMPVEQSMRNGGGPACLRLRAELTSEERYACHRDVFLTTELYETLVAWIDKYYRDELTVDDLRDPKLMNESFHALDELTRILNLPRLYFFQ